MRINPGDTVQCYDESVYDISHPVDGGKYVAGVKPDGSQRLFKPNGQYAGADRSKNVARVL